jgi:hypothetical protein
MIAAAGAAGALLGTTAATASAWPLPLTSDDVNFLNQARGNFPGDDDTLLIVGKQMCRGLYTGQSPQAVIDSAASTYGASPDQAGIVLRAARGTLCTSAPG